MKKLIFTASMCIAVIASTSINSYALFGIHIHYERGAKDKEGNCQGRGCCIFDITVNGLEVPILAGSQDGVFGIQVDAKTVAQYSEDFQNNTFVVNSQQTLSADFARKCGLEGEIIIHAGRYPINWDSNGNAIILFQ